VVASPLSSNLGSFSGSAQVTAFFFSRSTSKNLSGKQMSVYESIGSDAGPTTKRRRTLCGVAIAGFLALAATASTVLYLWLSSPAKTPPGLPQVTQVAKRGFNMGRDEYLIYAATGCKISLLSFDFSKSILSFLAVSSDLGCRGSSVGSLGVSVTGLDVVVSVGSGLVHLKTKPSAWTPNMYKIPTAPGQSIGRVANAVKIDGHEIYFYVFEMNGTSAVGALNVSDGLVHAVDSIGILFVS